MLLRRNIVQLLDRPGGRFILGMIATYLSRRYTGPYVEVFYDGLWVNRVGPYYFPYGRRFNSYRSSFRRWKNQAKRYLSNAEEMWFRHYRPREGDVVIDIGAGQGEDILAFSQAVGKTGRVIAIEAHPLSFEILESFCCLNRLTNTTPLPVAVMEKSGTVSMDESEMWEANAVNQTYESSEIEVRAATLDDICEAEAVKDVAFLKMNIEGAERYALLGMESIIQRVRTICVACHDFRADLGHGEHFRTRTLVQQFLEDHGFEVASRPEDPRGYVRDHLFGLRARLL